MAPSLPLLRPCCPQRLPRRNPGPRLIHPLRLALPLVLLALLLPWPLNTMAMQVLPFSLGSGPITFDFSVRAFTPDGYLAYVNSYSRDARCRKVLGWSMAWAWPQGQFLWNITGAQVENTGDCSTISNYGGRTPYSCSEVPWVSDIRSPNNVGTLTMIRPAPTCRTSLCGQLLHSIKVIVGNATNRAWGFKRPQVYRVPGHICTAPRNAPLISPRCPMKSLVAWRVTCFPL